MHRVFVDANVLGSRTQYDWLFQLRLRVEMFSLWTSGDVVDEANRAWRLRHPNADGAMREKRTRIFSTYFDEVSDDWAGGSETQLRDRHDSHVHNAAVSTGADVLLTDNLRDFEGAAERPYDVYSPDTFFMLIERNAPQAVRDVTRDQALYWNGKREEGTARRERTLSDALRHAQCPMFADVVEGHLRVLADATDVTR
ncbi:PIN domain-containing protein [Microbacterium halophytorum]|uniref:PIN domain-containing protein n=1 Tax=Microbacterium halophytorum TaxID=2067568 RepID=UPI001319F068|nr:PIN domain-containing protein [Microbacterium halophytorum]